MSTFRNPVGPQPTNVYWRRRLIVGLGIVAVIVIILLIVFSPKGGTPTAIETTPANVPSSSAPPTDDSADAPACDKDDVAVTALTDKKAYAEGELPQISFQIANTGDAACTVNAGSDVQVYTITSGDETIWTSTDCQSDPVAATAVLAAGEKTESQPFEWDRTRSSAKTCDDEDLPKVTAKGATYRVAVAVDGIESAEDRAIILN